MSELINVWLFPIQEEILVTDQTGGVPVDCCNLPEYYNELLFNLTGSSGVLYEFNKWEDATSFAESLVKNKLHGWEIKYDNWYGRQVESEQNEFDYD